MPKRKDKPFRMVREFIHRVLAAVGAAGLALAFFLILPLMQTINKPPNTDTLVQTVNTAQLEPPPPPPEEEKEEEEKPEEKPPELNEEAPPLDLSQIELALNPGGIGDGSWMGPDFSVKLNTMAASGGDSDALWGLSDLDQEPRAIYQPSPLLTQKLKKKGGGTVWVIFIVDKNGRVENPIVQSSPDPVYDNPTLSAVKQWKFEPGKRNGNAVRFRMKAPITYPKG